MWSSHIKFILTPRCVKIGTHLPIWFGIPPHQCSPPDLLIWSSRSHTQAHPWCVKIGTHFPIWFIFTRGHDFHTGQHIWRPAANDDVFLIILEWVGRCCWHLYWTFYWIFWPIRFVLFIQVISSKARHHSPLCEQHRHGSLSKIPIGLFPTLTSSLNWTADISHPRTWKIFYSSCILVW